MMTLETLKTTNGYYWGKKVNNFWYIWYWPWGFFTRGNCEIWIDSLGLHFRLYLTKRVRDLPLASIKNISIRGGYRWLSTPAIWIGWTDGKRSLSSGFSVSKSRVETEKWVNMLKSNLGDKQIKMCSSLAHQSDSRKTDKGLTNRSN